jgi:hypothetical protein
LFIPQKIISRLSEVAEGLKKVFQGFPKLRKGLKKIFKAFRSYGRA